MCKSPLPPSPRFQCWGCFVAISGGPWKKSPRPENTHCDILPNIEIGGKGVWGKGGNAFTPKSEFQLFSPIYGLRIYDHSPTYVANFTKRYYPLNPLRATGCTKIFWLRSSLSLSPGPHWIRVEVYYLQLRVPESSRRRGLKQAL